MTDPLSNPLRAGDLLAGRFRVVRLLGAGGMGAVYEAENTVTGKRVALKCITAVGVIPPSSMQRLLREARATSRISHPNVIDIYDAVQEGEQVVLVMELLHGETLGALLGRGELPLSAFFEHLIAAMRGVAAAHRQGVIHRDIKPDNIFLAERPDHPAVVKVLDFGISKVIDAATAPLTQTGSLLGTPLYMSPEQLSDPKSIDERSDVYAFGVILYQALTGSFPFEARSLGELIFRMSRQPLVPPRQLRPAIPAALDRLVCWALTLERGARLGSLDAFIAELEPFASARGLAAQRTDDGTDTLCVRAPRPSVDAPTEGIAGERVSSVPAPLVTAAASREGKPAQKVLRWGVSLLVLAVGLLAALLLSRPAPGATPEPEPSALRSRETAPTAIEVAQPSAPRADLPQAWAADAASTSAAADASLTPAVADASLIPAAEQPVRRVRAAGKRSRPTPIETTQPAEPPEQAPRTASPRVRLRAGEPQNWEF